MKTTTALLAVFIVLTVVFASVAANEYEINQGLNASTTTATSTAFSQYPVTFLGPPKGCVIEAFCINITMANHLGSNFTAVEIAWLRNATTGQNVTMLGDNRPLAAASCEVVYPVTYDCYIIAHPIYVNANSTYEVTLWAVGVDGKTVLSPTVTANVTDYGS